MGVPRKFMQSEIGPAVDIPWASAIEAIVAAGQTIVVNDIVIVNGRSSSLMQVVQADADAVLTSRGLLYVAVTGGAAGARITMVPWRVIGSVNTNGAAVGDEVFLSNTAGGWSLTAGTVPIQVGEVLAVSATVGVIQLYPSASFGGGAAALSGTEQLTFTINDDATAATDEDPALILLGGDAVAAPNDDLVRSRLMQDSTAEQLWVQTERSRNAGAYARISVDFGIGRQGETTASLDALLHFNASTDAGAARRYNVSHLGQEGTLALYYDQAGTVSTPSVLIGRDGETTASIDAILGMTAATDAAAARRSSLTYRGQEHSLEWSSATAALTLSLVGTGGLGIKTAAADANQSASLSASQLNLGAGGATAVDWVLARQAANIVELGGGDSLFAVGAGLIGVRAIAADANATSALDTARLRLGINSADALSWSLTAQAANVAEIGSGDSLFALGAGAIGVKTGTGDAGALVDISSAGLRMGAGGASAVDVILARQAADVATFASGDSLYVVAATLGVRALIADANATASLSGDVLSLGAGGASVVDWILDRTAADVAELGSADSLFAVGAGTIGVRAATGEANPTARLSTTALALGISSVDALSWTLTAQAASIAELGSGDSLFAVGAGVLGVRAIAADTNPTARLSTTALALGINSADALSWSLTAQAASVAELGSGDALYAVAGIIGVRAATAEANATAALDSTRLRLGINSADALSWSLTAQATNVAEIGSGDSLFALGAGIIGVKTGTGDAGALVDISSQGIRLGAGGGSAVDVILSRGAANRLDLAAGDTLRTLGFLETLDDVGSGNVRRVGGSILRTVDESANVAGAEAAFAGGAVTIAAAALKVGTRIRFDALVRVSAAAGGLTSQVLIRIGAAGTGGTLAFDTTSRTIADEDIISLEGYLDVRANGAGGTATGVCRYYISAADTLASAAAAEWGQDVAGSAAGTWTVAVDTTIARDLTITGATDGAGTILNLESFRVWLEA